MAPCIWTSAPGSAGPELLRSITVVICTMRLQRINALRLVQERTPLPGFYSCCVFVSEAYGSLREDETRVCNLFRSRVHENRRDPAESGRSRDPAELKTGTAVLEIIKWRISGRSSAVR